MPNAIRVIGFREFQRALRLAEGELAPELRRNLREAGKIVREEAVALFAPISAASAAGYRVRVRSNAVAVGQSRRKVTGERPDYGALQMRLALLPALDRRQEQVVQKLEEMLDRIGSRNGF